MCCSSLEGCYDSVQDTVTVLRKVGFCINEGKSVLEPTQCTEYLGNIIDSVNMTVTLPKCKTEKLVQCCSTLQKKERQKIREVARVIGTIVAAIPAVEIGKLYYRKLESAKICALDGAKGNFDECMAVTDVMKSDLNWWINEVANQDRKIFRKGTEIDLYTDASNIGWGGCLNGQSTNGKWSTGEKLLHINALELKAILFALKSFAHHLKGKHIRVFSDNTTAVNYVNEMGGIKSLACNDICIEIWDWIVKNDAWVSASHIPGKDNTLADTASRQCNDRHEWKLNESMFRELCVTFGTPDIDLFASRLNKQIKRFCSWKPDPEAEHFDAFTINWAQFELIYMFPPFSLISRCLQKMRAEEARGWLVVPLWTTQPWMGTLLKMLVDEPRIIKRRKNVLRHPSTTEEHPIMRHTKLMACSLSGKTYENKAYLQRVRTSYWLHGDQERRNSIDHITIKPHKEVSKDTIARWIRRMLVMSGVDTTKYSAGSVRPAAASKAKAMAVPITFIMAKAGWSSEATFAKCYDKIIVQDSDTFQDAVLE
ncbi:hypothetical protein Pcinc_005794 [Petrolisthes cinctipes]|uniref:Reverse transcriptase RNase H-like domain-containing protein n=1 Tax=Petrolisthes cinctipes TaxID=88211 RepID=A0AAE1GBY7_PETCI|nr:hypothetical protein Pcinc_005794 [Petrolisthes cinctipes]